MYFQPMKLFKTLFLFFISFPLFSQHQDKVDFIHAEAEITPVPIEKEIKGSVTYTFNVLEKVDSVFLDAKNMKFSSVKLNNRKIKYSNNQEIISIFKKFKAGKQYKLSLSYETKPKQTVYFVGEVTNVISSGVEKKDNANQIWTQGQGKYTSHWLPSFDDMTEKVEFDLVINTYEDDVVIANGKLNNILEIASTNNKRWVYDMQKPMSSYLLAFVVGNFEKKTITSTSGVPIELYYEPKDSLKVEPTYRYSKQIFDFLENEIGVPYPWQNYKQTPVRDFLYAGMENTSATIFSNSYMVDSIGFQDKNYINVNAHELAHQWFGDMVTEESGSHHWLQEGFATYYALLAEKEIFGSDYFYWKLYKSAQQLDKQSKDGNAKALTNPKASSLTFYQKGAWALYMLKDEVGENAFKKGMKSYLEKHQYKNVMIEDFMSEIEMASDKDLSQFKNEWLLGTVFPYNKVKENLREQNQSLAHFFDLQRELTTSNANNEAIIKRYWNKSSSTQFKVATVEKYHALLSNSFKSQLLQFDDIKVIQAIALAMDDIPKELKLDFETLLTDKSYVTIENVLYKLWVYHSEDRAIYLDKTRGVIGLPDKNIRLLWLTFANLTKGYDNDKKNGYLEELRRYTSSEYGFEIRRNTFQYLNDIFGFTDQNLKDLANACIHHSWRFKNFSRNILDKQLEKDNIKNRFVNLLEELNEEEQRYIKSKLNLE